MWTKAKNSNALYRTISFFFQEHFLVFNIFMLLFVLLITIFVSRKRQYINLTDTSSDDSKIA